MFKKYFKTLDFQGLKNFIYELMNAYGFYEIRFYPENKNLFNNNQLTHIAPFGDIDHKEGFIWAWRQNIKRVRRTFFNL